MIGKDIDVTPMEAFFLMVLNGKKSLSGSEIVQNIRENLGLNWTPSAGATYKILQSMEKKELIIETTQKEDREDQRMRTYAMAVKGKETLPIITKRILKIALFVDSCCPELISEEDNVIRIVRIGNGKNSC
ncbi:MAG TPA: PadR family transcriptional regulator [Candidatus Bathyarchaeia archaeon]|nr:PadR family transcriptional regulator [Candidatus Bathyarchaeia archaeon]